MARLNKTPLLIRAKRGLASQVTASSPVPYQREGEIAYSTDTKAFYISDGNAFNFIGDGYNSFASFKNGVEITGSLDVSGSGNFTNGLTVTGSVAATGGITAGGTITTNSEAAFRTNGTTNNTYSRLGIFRFQGWQSGTQTAFFNGWNQQSYINSPLNIGIASTTMPARLRVRGSGTTSSTTALLVENSNASASLVVLDDGNVGIGTTTPTNDLVVNSITNNGGITLQRNGVDAVSISRGGTPSIQIRTSLGATRINLIGGDGSYFRDAVLFGGQTNKVTNHKVEIQEGTLIVTGSNGTALIASSSGNVGVGTPLPSYRLDVSGSGNFTDGLTITGSTNIYKSGSTVLNIEGSTGQLFSVTDSLTGSLFSVNTVAGLPVIEAFSDNTVNIGKFGSYPVKVINSGTEAVITGSFTGSLDGSASSAETASYVNPLVQDVEITGSILQSDGIVDFSNSTSTTSLRVNNIPSVGSTGNGIMVYGTGSTSLTNNQGLMTFFAGNTSGIAGLTFANQNSGNHRGAITWNAGGRGIEFYASALTYYGNIGWNSSGWFIGNSRTSASAKLHIRGSGTTSSTTALLVQNSSEATIIDAKDSLNIGIGHSALNATLNIGSNTYNGSLAVAAIGSQNRVALLGNIEFVSNATGGTWSGQSIFAAGANRTFRFRGSGNLNASDTEVFNFGASINAPRTVDHTSFRFAGGYNTNTLAADYTFVKIDGSINQTTLNQSGSVTGIYYNPNFFQLTGSHTAIQTTSGDVKFQGNNNVEITGSLTVSGSSTFTNIGPAVLSGSLTVADEDSLVPVNIIRNDNNSTLPVKITNNNAGGRSGLTFSLPNNSNQAYSIGVDTDRSFKIGEANLSGNTRFVINPSGKVGINTTSPSSTLHVKGTGTTSSTTALLVENSSGTDRLSILDDGTIAFNTSRLHISSSGIVSIGTAAPKTSVGFTVNTTYSSFQNGTNHITVKPGTGIYMSADFRFVRQDYANRGSTSGDLTVGRMTTGGVMFANFFSSSLNNSSGNILAMYDANAIRLENDISYRSKILNWSGNSYHFVAQSGSSYTNVYTISPEGNTYIAGRLNVDNGITGSLEGTASFATTASYAYSASYINPLVQDVTITGSLTISGSSTYSLISNRVINAKQGIYIDNGYYLKYAAGNTGFRFNNDNIEIYNNSGTRIGLFELTGITQPIRLGLGISSGLSSTLHVKGSGATSSTKSLRIENSSALELLSVDDDGNVKIAAEGGVSGSLTIGRQSSFNNGTRSLTINSYEQPQVVLQSHNIWTRWHIQGGINSALDLYNDGVSDSNNTISIGLASLGNARINLWTANTYFLTAGVNAGHKAIRLGFDEVGANYRGDFYIETAYGVSTFRRFTFRNTGNLEISGSLIGAGLQLSGSNNTLEGDLTITGSVSTLGENFDINLTSSSDVFLDVTNTYVSSSDLEGSTGIQFKYGPNQIPAARIIAEKVNDFTDSGFNANSSFTFQNVFNGTYRTWMSTNKNGHVTLTPRNSQNPGLTINRGFGSQPMLLLRSGSDVFNHYVGLNVSSSNQAYISFDNSGEFFIGSANAYTNPLTRHLRIRPGTSTVTTISGKGTTSSTTALLVENSNASASLEVLDNGDVEILNGRLVLQNGDNSVYIGLNTGTNDDKTNNSNIGIGPSALASVTSGTANVAVGRSALADLTTGNYNVAIGNYALGNNITEQGITAIGYSSQINSTSGRRNTSLGFRALSLNETGDNNVVIGYDAQYNNSVSNVVLAGYLAGKNNSGGSVVGLGYQTLQNNSGGGNTALGYLSGYSTVYQTGSNNTFLGYQSTYSSSASNISNSTAVGANVTLTDSNTVILGNDANVGIGTTSPSYKLDVSGSVGIHKSGSTVLDIQGSQGQLFSVVDELSGSLMSVNDVSGLPILEVFSDDRVEMGTYGSPGLVVTGSDVNINSGSLNVQGQQLDAAFIWFMG